MFERLTNIFKGLRFSNRQHPSETTVNVDEGQLILDKTGFLQFFTDDDKLRSYLSKRQMLDEGFGLNPYAYTVIDRLSRIAARLPRQANNERSKNVVRRLPNDLEGLLAQPNPLETFQQWYYRIHANLRATGEAFIFAIKPTGFNKPAELLVPNVDEVTIHEDNFGMPESYEIHYHNRVYNITDLSTVLHIYFPDITFDTLRGFSPLQANGIVYRTNNEVWYSEYHLQKNKGVNGIITNDGERPWTPTEQKQMQAMYDKESTGRNFGKVRVSSAKLRYLNMGMNPNDLKSVESRLAHLQQICACQDVSSILFNDTAASTFHNYKEAKTSMYTDSILPLCSMVDQALTRWLIQGFFGLGNVIYQVDETKIAELNKPNLDLSNKVMAEFTGKLIPRVLAQYLLYPQYYPKPTDEELTAAQNELIEVVEQPLTENPLNDENNGIIQE